MSNHLIDQFISFVHRSPTSHFAKREIIKSLAQAGFQSIDDIKHPFEAEKGYFISCDQTLIAFKMPKEKAFRARVLLSHLDSPALKLKNKIALDRGLLKISMETYGGPTLISWLDCPLRIAGEILYDRETGVEGHLFDSQRAVGLIPGLAPHLDPVRNKEGTKIDKQKDLKFIISCHQEKERSFIPDSDKVIAQNLFAIPAAPLSKVGLDEEMLVGYRLDNMTSVYASLLAILSPFESQQDRISMAVFFDHEEIGSQTRAGASSHLLKDLLDQLIPFKGFSHSSALSLDVGHAFTPSYSDKFDSEEAAHLGMGVLLKKESQGRYAHDLRLEAFLKKIASVNQLPLQLQFNHSSIPSGSTVGNIVASKTTIATQDCGIALFSMHSTQESCSCRDLIQLCQLVQAYLAEPLNEW